jgi:serine/threonine protein kinase
MDAQPSKKDFQLLKEVGKGSYGTVYKAIDRRTNKIVAVKVLSLEQDWLPLLKEVNMVTDLQNDGIVNYYGWFFEDGCLWLIMEFCDGGSLCDIIKTLEKPLTETQLSAVCRAVLRSLAYVHSLRRIHRDIKGGNLLITSEGIVKLCDFGVSAQLDEKLQQTSTRIGSPYWMAPEVIQASGHDTKADIWSFGITALELFTGQPPLHDLPVLAAMMKIPTREPPRAPQNASHRFKSFIRHILVQDPAARPTAAELLNDRFITMVSERAGVDVLRGLVNDFLRAKAAKEAKSDEEGGEEEDEEEEEEEEEDEAFAMRAATILWYDATGAPSGTMVVEPGTMVMEPATGKSSKGALSDWKPEFVDTPVPPQGKLAQVQKRNFRNFSVSDLKVMLTSVRALAEQEIAKGKTSRELIIENYEEVRAGIVQELKLKGQDIPDDYQILK